MPSNKLSDLFKNNFPAYKLVSVERLPISGSDRQYFRLTADNGFSVIGTVNSNLNENESFIKMTRHFLAVGCKVPEIYAVSEDGYAYLQQDLGKDSLLTVLEREGYTPEVKELFAESLRQLAFLQVKGHEGFDYNWCLTSKEFGRQALMADLLYCKYYFIDLLKIAYDKEKLIEDFDAFANYLSHVQERYFMFRDFQSRNIMVHEGAVYFIDYQGGMQGAIHYDAASLLWQAKANLPDEWKKELLNTYFNEVNLLLPAPIHQLRFESVYYGYVLVRLMQVLGAYGLRGIFERKAHFLTSIPIALENLRNFLETRTIGLSLPELERLLKMITMPEVIARFKPVQAEEATPLTVHINSFSFIKRGYPAAFDENGGGFVFDCRGILNPGRIDNYKTQSGRDKPVKDYLEQNTRMPEFLNQVYNIVDISVEDYLARGFKSLTVNFGCTGGQHRSVYAADALARHLRNKYKVRTEVRHLEEDNWKKVL